MFVRLAWIIAMAACTGTDRAGKDHSDPGDTDPPTTDTSHTGSSDTHTDTGTEPTGPLADDFVYHSPVVDLLFVIDNSSSMYDKNQALVGSLDAFVAAWLSRGIAFHIGATDIDDSPAQGRLEVVGGARWAEPTSPDPGSMVQALVSGVADPTSVEAGRQATVYTLERVDAGEINEGFLRDGSELAIVVHTDETDQSGPEPVTEAEFVTYLQTLRPGPGRVAFHSIVGTSDYANVTAAVGGITWDVWNTPYGPVLQAITDMIDRTNTFTLSADAEPGSIAVAVTPPGGAEDILDPGTFTYDPVTRVVDLQTYVPVDLSAVSIHYGPPAAR